MRIPAPHLLVLPAKEDFERAIIPHVVKCNAQSRPLLGLEAACKLRRPAKLRLKRVHADARDELKLAVDDFESIVEPTDDDHLLLLNATLALHDVPGSRLTREVWRARPISQTIELDLTSGETIPMEIKGR